MVESEEYLKSLFMRLKEESEKADLKLTIQKKKKILRSIPSLLGKFDRKGKAEAVTDFIFLGPKSLQTVTVAMKLNEVWSLAGKLWHN